MNSSSNTSHSRRDFLWNAGAGFTGLALTAMLERDGFFARSAHAATSSNAQYISPLAEKAPPLFAKAKRCIFLFMYGGPSQMDLFDYKPELQKRDGQTVSMEIRRRDLRPSTLLASRRQFNQCG